MRYTINPGYSFLDDDGSTKTGGDTIDLSDESAAQHREKVTPQADSEAVSDAQSMVSRFGDGTSE